MTQGSKADYTYIATKQTTNATATIIETIAIPEDDIVGFFLEVKGIKSDGSVACHFVRHVAYKNDGGTVTIVGRYINAQMQRENTGLLLTQVISGTTVQFKVKGLAATTINWTSKITQTL